MSARPTASERQRALREQLAADSAAFEARGGQVRRVEQGAGRLNPLNEDRNNNFLNLSRKR